MGIVLNGVKRRGSHVTDADGLIDRTAGNALAVRRPRQIRHRVFVPREFSHQGPGVPVVQARHPIERDDKFPVIRAPGDGIGGQSQAA